VPSSVDELGVGAGCVSLLVTGGGEGLLLGEDERGVLSVMHANGERSDSGVVVFIAGGGADFGTELGPEAGLRFGKGSGRGWAGAEEEREDTPPIFPSSASESFESRVPTGQESPVVVVCVAVTSHRLAMDEPVVVQLDEPLADAQKTHQSVIFGLVH